MSVDEQTVEEAPREPREPRRPPPAPGRNEPVAPRKRTSAAAKRKQRSTEIAKQLSDAARGAAGMMLMLSPNGLAVVSLPGIPEAVDSRCDSFGQAWAAVAEENERVAVWIGQLLTGGVWIAAGVQTAALAILLATLSGRELVPIGTAAWFLPELRPFLNAPPAAAEPEPAVNGQPGFIPHPPV